MQNIKIIPGSTSIVGIKQRLINTAWINNVAFCTHACISRENHIFGKFVFQDLNTIILSMLTQTHTVTLLQSMKAKLLVLVLRSYTLSRGIPRISETGVAFCRGWPLAASRGWVLEGDVPPPMRST